MRFKSRCLNLIVLVCLLGMCAHAQASGSTQNEGKRTQLGKSVCCSFTSNITPLLETTLAVPEPLAEDECDWFTDEHHLAYTGNRLIIAGFHLNCLQRHGSSPPVRIHTLDVVLQVDPDTGNVLHLTEWKDVSTRRNGSGDLEILPVQDGKFLVLVGKLLKLFSGDFIELKSRSIAPETTEDEHWIVQAVSDQMGFFTIGGSGRAQQEDHWFSIESLEDQLVEKVPSKETSRAVPSSSAVYFSSPPGKEVLVRERGQQETRPFCSSCSGLPLAIVPAQLLFISTGNKASFMLVTPGGKIVHRASYGKGVDFTLHIATASAAPRFSFGFGHLAGGPFSYGSIDTVVVFDTKKMTDVLRLKIKQRPERYSNFNIKGEHWPGEATALSPDGTFLSVLSGVVLKSFRVPH